MSDFDTESSMELGVFPLDPIKLASGWIKLMLAFSPHLVIQKELFSCDLMLLR